MEKQLLLDPLTERELDILRLMGEGLTNREIAEKLVLEAETVRWYTKQIYSKLGVHSRTQASLRAKDLALFTGKGAETVKPPVAPPPSNLPAYGTSFVGREGELREIKGLLQDPAVRITIFSWNRCSAIPPERMRAGPTMEGIGSRGLSSSTTPRRPVMSTVRPSTSDNREVPASSGDAELGPVADPSIEPVDEASLRPSDPLPTEMSGPEATPLDGSGDADLEGKTVISSPGNRPPSSAC